MVVRCTAGSRAGRVPSGRPPRRCAPGNVPEQPCWMPEHPIWPCLGLGLPGHGRRTRYRHGTPGTSSADAAGTQLANWRSPARKPGGRAAVAPSSRPCALALQHRVPRPRHLRAGRKRHHPARRRARVPRPGHRTVVDGPGRQHGHRLADHRRALRRGRASVRARPRRRRLPRSRSHRPLARRVAGTSGGGHGLIALAAATTKCFPMIQISGSSERRSGTLRLVHARESAPWMSQPRR